MERVDALREAVDKLREEIAPEGEPSLSDRIDHLAEVHGHLAEVVDHRTGWWRGAVAVGVVLVLAITGGGFLIELRTRAEIGDANRKLCPLIALLIPTDDRRPTTQYGRQLAEQAGLLYAAYGCNETNGAAPHA